jgi:hypothetical protein
VEEKQFEQMNIRDPREMNRIMQQQWFEEEARIREHEKMMAFEHERAWKEADMEARR